MPGKAFLALGVERRGRHRAEASAGTTTNPVYKFRVRGNQRGGFSLETPGSEGDLRPSVDAGRASRGAARYSRSKTVVFSRNEARRLVLSQGGEH